MPQTKADVLTLHATVEMQERHAIVRLLPCRCRNRGNIRSLPAKCSVLQQRLCGEKYLRRGQISVADLRTVLTGIAPKAGFIVWQNILSATR